MSATIDVPMSAGGSRLLPVLGGELVLAAETHGWFGRLLARHLGLPTADVGAVVGSLQIDIEPAADVADRCERWTRTFGDRTWASTLAPGPHDTVVEHTGPIELEFTVRLDDRWITHMTLRSIRLASLPTPIARWVEVVALIEPNGTTLVTMGALGGRCTYRAMPATPAMSETSAVPETSAMPHRVTAEVVR